MPGFADPQDSELGTLLAFLAQQRYVLRLAAYGLTEVQLRLSPTASALSIGGLIKHVCRTEAHWLDIAQQQPAALQPGDYAAYAADFRLDDGETLAGILQEYDAVARRTEETARAAASLDAPVTLPDDPWFAGRREGYSLRWVLGHLIAETARHAGHADIIREAIDGGTAFELMAAAEHWPAMDWIRPWRPQGQ
jgi:uncharacterized damage-inducible protein DinB